MASRFPRVGRRESMLPRPRLGGDSPRMLITFPSTTRHVLGLAGLRVSCIYWRLITMRRSANDRVSSRPKKSGNTAAGIPRPSGEGVHLPGAGAVANRDQVSAVLLFYFVFLFPFVLPRPFFACAVASPVHSRRRMLGWLGTGFHVAGCERGDRQMSHCVPTMCARGQLISSAPLPTCLLLRAPHMPWFLL